MNGAESLVRTASAARVGASAIIGDLRYRLTPRLAQVRWYISFE